MTPKNTPTPTHIYLLSVWQEKDSGKEKLRFCLEDPHTGERLGFNSPKTFVAYFQDKLTDPKIKRDL